MEAKHEDLALAGRALEDLVAAVDEQRARGLSVAAACRAAGVSTSTYYRRRRTGERAPALGALALAAPAPAPEWPFERATPRAPFYWDQAFADELTDSYVRREFGAGEYRARQGRALASLAAAPPAAAQRLRRLWRRLANGPLGAAGPPLAGLAVIVLLIAGAGWIVSQAADPAAWLRNPQAVQTLAAGAR